MYKRQAWGFTVLDYVVRMSRITVYTSQIYLNITFLETGCNKVRSLPIELRGSIPEAPVSLRVVDSAGDSLDVALRLHATKTVQSAGESYLSRVIDLAKSCFCFCTSKSDAAYASR